MTRPLVQPYLALMEKCLINDLYRDPALEVEDEPGPAPYHPAARLLGLDVPSQAHTHIGLVRLRHIRTLVERILRDEVPGDLMEVGVGRGGACIYMRALLAAHEVEDRQVLVGGPDTRDNFATYSLLDDQVVFEPDLSTIDRLALLRLTGDDIGNTLQTLYDKVSEGGYVVVDGYFSNPRTRDALQGFPPMLPVDDHAVYWQKPITAIPVPSRLAPVAGPRPFWSVIIPVYNRLEYLQQCIESVLSQAPDEMDILVADDCSAVDIEPLIRRWGGERVRYYRGGVNIGQWRNVNRALSLVAGQWIHILHDDDYVLPGFYSTLQQATGRLDATVGVACCAYTNLLGTVARGSVAQRAVAGVLNGWLKAMATSNQVTVPSVVVRREVYETIGVYHEDIPYCADWEFFVRAALHYDWWYEPENLACYRMHPDSVSFHMLESGETARDIRTTLERMALYLPDDVVTYSLPMARAINAEEWIKRATEALRQGRTEAAARMAAEAYLVNPPK